MPVARVLPICVAGIMVALGSFAIPLACAPSEPPAGSNSSILQPAHIVAVSGATGPAIGTDRAYQPVWKPSNGEGGEHRYARIHLDVQSGVDAVLRVRMGDTLEQQAIRELARIESPGELVGDSADWPASVLEPLNSAGGVFWSVADQEGSQQRIEVLLTESNCPALAYLEVFASVTPDNFPWGSDRIELSRDFFYLAAVGDSVMWGNGLPQRNKISYLLARQVEQATGLRVIEQLRAMSGACIVPSIIDGRCEPDCHGEVSAITNSITRQVSQLEGAEELDLILLDGCINDVDILNILNPELPAERLSDLTTKFCHDQMLELLRTTRARAPQARIAVLGYFQAVSEVSDLLGFQQWMLSQGVAMDASLGARLMAVADNWSRFRQQSDAELAAAVEQVNQDGGGPAMVCFAPSGFGAENAMFSPQSLLWSMSRENRVAVQFETDLQLFPEDPLLGYRLARCAESPSGDSMLTCIYASVGHPNFAGAVRYADSAFQTLLAENMLP